MSPKPSTEHRLTGRHVLLITLAFFGAIFAVDGAFAWRALATFPGEVSSTAYEDGLAYNRTLAAREQATALSWRVDVAGSRSRGSVLVRVVDAQGAPIPGLSVAGSLTRPATLAGRQSLVFHGVRPGVFSAEAPVGPGAWDLTLQARDGHGHVFEAERRLVWP